MSSSFTICVGTVGTGIWRSTDAGETWKQVHHGLWNESRVYGLTAHPTEPQCLYAGTDSGLYRSHDGGERFEHIDSPMDDRHVWKIAVDPVDSQTLFVGTRPSALFRSRDAGTTWEQLDVELAEECPAVRIPRVTALVVDPENHNTVWAGIEVDGVQRSLDGGDSWMRIVGGLNDPDIHDIALRAPNQVLVSTPKDIFVSTDVGESWHGLGVRPHFSHPYCRALALPPHQPEALFVATGDSAIGSTGAIQRSLDGGQHWDQPALPVKPNTPMWAFATHAACADVMVSCSHYGEVFVSRDNGAGWDKTEREFSEIRALALLPAQ